MDLCSLWKEGNLFSELVQNDCRKILTDGWEEGRQLEMPNLREKQCAMTPCASLANKQVTHAGVKPLVNNVHFQCNLHLMNVFLSNPTHHTHHSTHRDWLEQQVFRFSRQEPQHSELQASKQNAASFFNFKTSQPMCTLQKPVFCCPSWFSELQTRASPLSSCAVFVSWNEVIQVLLRALVAVHQPGQLHCQSIVPLCCHN